MTSRDASERRKRRPLSESEAEQKHIKVDRDGLIRCRVCRCTEREPCDPPCAWFDIDLCSSCALVVEAIAAWTEHAHRVSMAALMREVDRYRRAMP